MHQNAFGGRAPPGPAGGAHDAPPDLLVGWGGGHSLPISLPHFPSPRRLRRLDSHAFGVPLGASLPAFRHFFFHSLSTDPSKPLAFVWVHLQLFTLLFLFLYNKLVVMMMTMMIIPKSLSSTSTTVHPITRLATLIIIIKTKMNLLLFYFLSVLNNISRS